VTDAAEFDGAGCSAGESFALRVIGHSMAPEFNEGDVIIVEPDGALCDGSYVLAQLDGEYTLRRLSRRDQGWQLEALNPAFAPRRLGDLAAVRGVVIQKSVPGRRRLSKRYV
jgi:SOS-response transcriptional repressor LexA